MNKVSYQIWYYLFIILGAVFLLSAYFVLGIGIRVAFILGVVYVISAQFMQIRVIRSREFNQLHKLDYAGSWPDYLLLIAMFAMIISGLVTDVKSSIYKFLLPLSFTGIISQTVARIAIRSPRYILTSDELQENDFHLRSRKLDDLHSITFDWTSLVARIRFVNQHDITIFRPRYSKQELANFLQAIIDQSPVVADIHPDVQEFIKQHAPQS